MFLELGGVLIDTAKMITLWITYQQQFVVELLVSSLLLLFYGFYIFSLGVAEDVSQGVVENVEADEESP